MKGTKVRYGTRWLSFLVIALVSSLVIPQSQGAEAIVMVSSVGAINYSTEAFGPEDILFEYGAEGADVGDVPKPPWDQVGGTPGSVNNDDVYVRATDAVARSGTEAVVMHQPAPYKSDAERRVICREYSTGTQDMYCSWWVYYPNNMDTLYAWRSLGGAQLRYGPSGDKWKERNGVRFTQESDGSINVRVDQIYSSVDDAQYGSPGQKGTYREYDTGYDMSDLLNEWHRLMVHFSIHPTNGAYEAWIDDDLVYSETGLSTDPRSEPEWNAQDYVWAYDYPNSPIPYYGPAFYNNQNEPECWYYWDDYVAATTYVPYGYGVA